MYPILLAHRSEDGARFLASSLEEAGHTVDVCPPGSDLLRQIHARSYDLIFIDVDRTFSDSLDVLHYVQQSSTETEVVVLTDVERIGQAASAIRRGAAFYLVEPLEHDELLSVVEGARRRRENAMVVHRIEHRGIEGFFGSSPVMARIFRLIQKVAPTNATILVMGESGTGKEVLANVIHRMSPRSSHQLVTVNCGAIPETLLESELFGHARGSFTGATTDKKGLLEEADKGTVFLDEIGDMPLALQVKVLRFLQERMVRRVGEVRPRRVDVRILCATNRDLGEEVREGRFREDLFYRINVVPIVLPPLRERKETIPFLLGSFLSRYSSQYGREILNVSPEAQQVLAAHTYPGNIRELENIIEYSSIMAEGTTLRLEDLPPYLLTSSRIGLPGPQANASSSRGEDAETPQVRTLAEMEKLHIKRTLDRCGGNQTQAAKELGISRTSLWRKLKEIDGSHDES